MALIRMIKYDNSKKPCLCAFAYNNMNKNKRVFARNK
jgi:hypothetical protein